MGKLWLHVVAFNLIKCNFDEKTLSRFCHFKKLNGMAHYNGYILDQMFIVIE